ncbi:hypothetical protein XM38_000800 [Halomicronema hongdechloris C2206]|uniref:Uncharacterized protein n=1 Tax=Halomicronema hongdechloris C2206 TaxID=1641165 RepID=A0A1Z3HFT4_9CYAN|nr:Tab2/Atab2 family RNA-binding protein [Halomicronema hongdechloris]ASC69154.1 hypothetical protein XM38_000800 [Halomicronema hongdechloris C2206]
MIAWQVDCYRRPLATPEGQPLWELLICEAADKTLGFTYGVMVPQSEVTAEWLRHHLQVALDRAPRPPEEIQVFRPQCLSLVEAAAAPLAILVVASRHTPTLKQWLQQRAAWYPSLDHYTGESYDSLALDRPPPNPLPESLWGEQWRFAAITAGEFERTFPHEPIPIRQMPPEQLPQRLGVASTTPIPGVVIDGGRQSMPLARWLQSVQPVFLEVIAGPPHGLVLEAGLVDRWILTTFADPQVAEAAQTF